MLAKATNVIVQIRGGASVTLGEVGIVMEELNRHISDRTQLIMGIAIDAGMGSRLSVSIISSLGDSSDRPVKAEAYPALQAPERPEIALAREMVPESASLAPVPEPLITLRLEDERPINGAKLDLVESAEPEEIPAPRKENGKETGSADKPAPKPAPKKIEAKQEVLQFDAVSRGRFEKSEPTIIDGQDLDVPTFLRRRVKAG
jgi:cell division protein FtsZ